MNLSERLKTVTCQSCGDRKIVGQEEMLVRLRAAGKLRRDAKPDPHLVLELFQKQIANDTCQTCGSMSLSFSELETDADDWNVTVLCEVCKTAIPPERMEIFPSTKRCAACIDKPAIDEEPEFCRLCGGLMVMRQSGGTSISRYVMNCTACGRNA